MPVAWHFPVQYTLDIHRKSQAFCDGQLEYHPASQTAILHDASGLLVDQLEPVGAGMLCPGGELRLTKTMLRVTESTENQVPAEKSTVVKTTHSPLSACQHEILYTSDKTKKTKTWHDGWMDLQASGLATFLTDDTDKILHRKQVRSMEEVAEGMLIETSTMLIEISAALSVLRVRRKASSTSAEPEAAPEEAPRSTEIPINTVQDYEILYTSDKIKKIKRWKDGRLKWSSSGLSTFYDEQDTVMSRRRIKPEELIDGYEFSTAQYIFQMGPAMKAPKPKCQPEPETPHDPAESSRPVSLTRCVSKSAGSIPRRTAVRTFPAISKPPAVKKTTTSSRSSSFSFARIIHECC